VCLWSFSMRVLSYSNYTIIHSIHFPKKKKKLIIYCKHLAVLFYTNSGNFSFDRDNFIKNFNLIHYNNLFIYLFFDDFAKRNNSVELHSIPHTAGSNTFFFLLILPVPSCTSIKSIMKKKETQSKPHDFANAS
jgi:hypothetical protein